MSIENGLQNILSSAPRLLWENSWRTVFHTKVTERAVGLLAVNSPDLPSEWEELDSAAYRQSLLPSDDQTWQECADLLIQEANFLNNEMASAGLPRLGRGALRARLLNVIPEMASSPTSGAIISENSFPAIWPQIANELACRIHNRNYAADVDPEWLLLNQLLLTGYFSTCRLPEARLVRQVFNEPRQKPMGFRGFFLRIPEFISDTGVDDVSIPSIAPVGGITLHHAGLTELLAATATESRHIDAGNGLLHQIIPTGSESAVPRNQWGVVTEDQLQQGRDAAFRLYEHTILAYLALACIEQLLRTWATNQTVVHMHSNGRPRNVLDWLDELAPSVALEDSIRDIYDSGRANIRNRIMHGNLMEIEGKALEVRLPIADPQRYEMPGVDPYLPENISSACMTCLRLLDQEIASRTTLTQDDLSWTTNFMLTADEVEFGYRLSVDFLTEERVEWLQYITRYQRAMMPALNQLFNVGFIGWLQRPFNHSIPRFMALGLVFEAIYRLTVHLLGHSVVQVSRPRATNQLKFQYRMLDARATGIWTNEILDHITAPIEPESRALAIDTFNFAMKARNAFSHGAITTFEQQTSDSIGHLIVKSVQALVSGGLQHMTNEASYFQWENDHESTSGVEEACWIAGEKQVFTMIRRAGAL